MQTEHRTGSSSLLPRTKPVHPIVPAAAGAEPVRVVRINARLNVGGIARHVAWLTAGLQPVGFESLLVAGTVPPGEDDMSDFARSQGVEPLLIPEMSREITYKDLLTVWKLYRLLVRVRPDVIHTHAAKAGAVGRLAGFLYRWCTPGALLGRPRPCRIVHTYHGHVFHSYYGPWKTWLFLTIERLLARALTDRIVVISPQQFQEIHETFGVGRLEQFAVIPLGLDLGVYDDWPSRRSTVREELDAGADDVLVGIVGRLTEIKNHGLFLQIAARFRHEHPDLAERVRFVVIGNGHLRAPLEAQAETLGLGSAVRFLGMRDDPQDFYPALDVVALTSHNEGTPLTLIEGMANARAVISTNVGGVVDLLGNPRADLGPVTPVEETADGWTLCERGIRVKPGDAAAFTNGLAHLVEDARLRADLGKHGRVFIEHHYSKERLLRDMASLYDELLAPTTADGGA